jgi:zinc transporter ZupT
MKNRRAFAVFHFALTALFSVTAFMALPGYRIWVLASTANLGVALLLVSTKAQRKLLCCSFFVSGLAGLGASHLTWPSGRMREEGILVLALLLGVMFFIAYDLYRSQIEAAA